MTEVTLYTGAVSIACEEPKCLGCIGERCTTPDGRYHQSRVNAAAKVSRERNREARQP